MTNLMSFGLTLALIGFVFFLGWFFGRSQSYMQGRIDGRAAERLEWGDVNTIIKKRVEGMSRADRQAFRSGEFEEPQRTANDPCPYDPSGLHDWHEVRVLGRRIEGGRDYRCSFCLAAKSERTLV